MQLSRFVIVYRDVSPGEHILFSVLTNGYVGVEDATLASVQRWATEAPHPHDRDTAEYLLEAGFLTASREMDDQRLKSYLDRAAGGIPETMHITLMPTLACDLACPYCFQKESPAFNRMQPGMEEASVRWILDRTATSACRRLHIQYVGGEPLTRKDYILRTAELFSREMSARGGAFTWNIITNGVQLTLPFVTALQQYGDGSIKITLDGDRETHDQTRIYRDGRGTFDILFANLKAVAGHVKDHVGGNFRPGQEESYERLLKRLEEADLIRHLESVRFKPVVEAHRSGSCTGCATPAQTAHTLVQITQSVQRRAPQMKSSRLAVPTNPCELHWTNSYTIDPDGGVYRCPAVAGRPEMAIGHVQADVADKPAPLLLARPWEQCGDCPYMPVCMGGCLGSKYLSTGRMDEVDCHKLEFEAIFRDTITARYRTELGAQPWHSVGSPSVTD
jgi:uncharacterized protein